MLIKDPSLFTHTNSLALFLCVHLEMLIHNKMKRKLNEMSKWIIIVNTMIDSNKKKEIDRIFSILLSTLHFI